MKTGLAKSLGDLTLTELNDLLPVGWQATLTDLSKKGELDNALIQALGVDFGTFYRLKKENAAFNAVVTECELLRLGFWQGVQRAMIFGDLSPKASGLLIRILERLEKRFDVAVDRVCGTPKDKREFLESVSDEELEAFLLHSIREDLPKIPTADLITELTKRGVDLTDATDDSGGEPLGADFLDGDAVDCVDAVENVENEPTDATPAVDLTDESDVPKSAAQAMRWRIERKQ